MQYLLKECSTLISRIACPWVTPISQVFMLTLSDLTRRCQQKISDQILHVQVIAATAHLSASQLECH